jgi:hypothetical protein
MDARGNYQFKPRLILAQLKKNTNHPTNTNVFYIYTRIHKAPTESHPQYRTWQSTKAVVTLEPDPTDTNRNHSCCGHKNTGRTRTDVLYSTGNRQRKIHKIIIL